jgi:hypothetical protein
VVLNGHDHAEPVGGDERVSGVFEVGEQPEGLVELVPDLTWRLSPRRVAHRQQANQAPGGQLGASQVQYSSGTRGRRVTTWTISLTATSSVDSSASPGRSVTVS